MKTTTEVISEISNQICYRPWRGGKSAIFFELGKEISPLNEKALRKGKYTIGIASCSWQVFQDDKLLISDRGSYETIDKYLSIFAYQRVLEIVFIDKHKREMINFSNEIKIMIDHVKLTDEWYILTPDVEFVVTGTGFLIEDSEVRKHKV